MKRLKNIRKNKQNIRHLSAKLSETRWECWIENVLDVQYQAAELCSVLEELQ